VLYRPKYYWKGLAIHGYSSVPPHAASHGCIRLTNAEMDWLWSSGFADLGAPVWIY
jgi:lipoprotein-anchoring transpeptidase ErfK/SrfK